MASKISVLIVLYVYLSVKLSEGFDIAVIPKVWPTRNWERPKEQESEMFNIFRPSATI
jgi:hypothetical protein